MTKTQILNTYGELLNKEDRDNLDSMFEGQYDTSEYYIRSFAGTPTGYPMTDGLIAGQEVVPGFPSDNYKVYSQQLIPVFEVEYLDTEVEKGQDIMHRYSGVRIGQSIYIIYDKDKDVVRSIDDPTKCTIQLNGIIFENRGVEAYSLVMACAHLQDKYDILHFYRDNIIATSGAAGDWLDLSMLPTKLGVTLPERIQKWLAYKKAGVALVDTSQEGRAFNNNTTFAGFDDTVKVQTIQGIQMAIESIEQTASSITGVFRERLNGVQQYDAVANVQAGARNSFIITKQYFQQIDNIIIELLQDSLNVAKVVFKKGLSGTIILGDKYQKIFTALPEHFTFTDYDIHIITSTDIIKDVDTVKQLTMELIKGGAVEADIIIDAITSRSLTELKHSVQNSMKKKKAENNIVAQLQQKTTELEGQLKQITEMNKKLEETLKQERNNRDQIELQKTKLALEVE